MRRVRWTRGTAWVAALMVSTLVAAGCVYPTPPPGDPIPSLTMAVSGPVPSSGTVTVTATPVNFAPTSVQFWVDTISGPGIGTDTTAPFTATVDTTTLTDGPHTVWSRGGDGTYTVLGVVALEVSNPSNLVMVLVDDLDETTTSYWDALPQTKALLADRGVTYTNTFATDPICCPARATLLTGQYPQNTGVFDNSAPDGGFESFVAAGGESDTVAVRLHDAGYRTGFAGKYLNGYEADPTHVPAGWDDWFGLTTPTFYTGYNYSANDNGTIVPFGAGPSDYQTDVVARQAQEFLEATEADDDQPFLLWLTPSAPHQPMPPAPRHADNEFTDDSVPTRPNFNEADVSDKPTWLREGVDSMTPANRLALRRDHRDRMGSLLAIDDMVAGLVDTLAANGELDDTVIVFTSDNGYNLGAHRLIQKMAPYEESIRVPMVIAGPGVRHGSEATFAAHVDITPTMLDIAGVAHDDLDGESLVPTFAGEVGPDGRELLIQFHGTYTAENSFDTLADVEAAIAAGEQVQVPTYRALRTPTHLYVEWYGGTEHEYELYDLAADPYQLTNLIATSAGAQTYASLTAQLQRRLETLSTCAGPSCRQ
jgi:N-acetylglucosamine-6-sulfatase